MQQIRNKIVTIHSMQVNGIPEIIAIKTTGEAPAVTDSDNHLFRLTRSVLIHVYVCFPFPPFDNQHFHEERNRRK